jgi:type I restriction enzyme S subunit
MTVPEEWVEKKLEEIADVKTGPFGSTLHASDYVKSGTPIITVEHLGECSITRQNLPLVSNKDKQRLNAYVLQEGDIIFSRVGSVDRNAYVSIHESGWLFSGRLLRIRSIAEDLDTKYLGYYFKSESVKAEIRNIAVGQTMASLNTRLLNTFEILLPPLPEQHAIAEVLSDMDGYIASLETLIAKKKAIKQGAMQELLTGKRRLPGFEGVWECFELGDLLDYEQPTEYIVCSTKYTLSGTPVLTAGKSFILGHTIEREGIYSKYPVILFDDFLTISRYIDFPFKVKSSAVKLLKNKREHDSLKLIYELMQMIKFTIVDHQRHWISQYSKIQLRLPLPKEQFAIAAVLSDMDAEIEVLTAKLNKAKLIKQGMMQELLTGKIRLVNVSPIPDEFTISEYMVILAIITRLFTDNEMKFLKHMRYQKLVYLYLVYRKAKTSIFEKWDYGPFSKELAYTVVPKAENEKSYIATDTNKNIRVGENINEAVKNAINKGYYKDAEQLAGKIRYKKDKELEVLATVVESIKDLEIAQKTISLQTVKEYIGSIPVWGHKLGLEYFTDFAIDKSINEYYDFFKR